MAVHRHVPSNPMELESICHEEWVKLPKWCGRLVEKYPKSLEAVKASTEVSTQH